MDAGLSTALLLTGAAQGLSTVGGLYASKRQAKLDKARIDYETATAELATADAAYENTQSFRRSLATQIATASLRGAPGSSIIRQFTTDSFSNYVRDQASISRRAGQVEIAGKIARANVGTDRLQRDLGLIGNYFSSAFSGVNLNTIGAKLGKAPGGAGVKNNG